MKSQNISQPAIAPAAEKEFGAGGIGQSVAQTARETASKIKSSASSTAAQVKEETRQVADEKKEQAAERVRSYGSALHESAKSLEPEDPNIAYFTHRVADRLENAADYVRKHDWRELRADAENAARRHPAVFFGGLFIVGLVAGNVLKASRRNLSSGKNDQPKITGYQEPWEPGEDEEHVAAGAETSGGVSGVE